KQIAGGWVNGQGCWGEAILAGRFQEEALFSRVRRAGAFQREKPDAAKRPVGEEDAAAVRLGKLLMAIVGNAGRRAAAQRGHGRNDIAEIWRPTPKTRVLR